MRKNGSGFNSGRFLVVIRTVFLLSCLVLACFALTHFVSFEDDKVDKFVSLQLKGSEMMYLYVGEAYSEPGYTASGDVTGNLSQYVTVSGDVDIKREGTYKISYKLDYHGAILEKIRIVKVSKKPVSSTVTKEDGIGGKLSSSGKMDKNSVSSGTTKPSTDSQNSQQKVDRINLRLNGYNEVYLLQGSNFSDLGAVATTDSGIDVSKNIVTSGVVDTSKLGDYTISYTVTDSLGDSVTLTRKVHVLKMGVSSTITTLSKTNKSLILNVSVDADKFSYVLLPNGKKTDSINFEYMITENGKYTFKVHNVYGLVRNYTYTISNIDKEAPNGSCSGYIKDGKSYINVKASDNSGILKYSINGKDYTSNDIVLESVVSGPNITIYDSVGNTRGISCTLENK